MTVGEFSGVLSGLLKIDDFSDVSNNGLQVGNAQAKVSKVAFAVDACLETIRRAAEEKADVLVVHHGLFWGDAIPVTGIHYARIKTLLDNNIALFGCHLPLDAHEELGNNVQMAKALELENLKVFSEFMGNKIGWYGELPKPMTVEQIIAKLGIVPDQRNAVLNFGKKENKTVGIISGGAPREVSDAINLGLDCYITGENSHQTYHTCREEHINMMCLGHYETETFGVKAVKKWVEDNLGLETCFLDVPTRL